MDPTGGVAPEADLRGGGPRHRTQGPRPGGRIAGDGVDLVLAKHALISKGDLARRSGRAQPGGEIGLDKAPGTYRVAESIALYGREGYPDAADLSMFSESIAKGGS